MQICLLGIDPGAKGAVAILYPDGIVDVRKMPETEKDVVDVITAAVHQATSAGVPIRAFLERVGGFIRSSADDEGNVAPATAMFSFGCGYGVIRGCLLAHGIPFENPTPQQWQKGLSMGTAGLTRGEYLPTMTKQQRAEIKKRVKLVNGSIKRAWKNKLKSKAQQLFPHLHVTLDTCDALLILEFARRQEIAAPHNAEQIKTRLQSGELHSEIAADLNTTKEHIQRIATKNTDP